MILFFGQKVVHRNTFGHELKRIPSMQKNIPYDAG